MIGVGRGEADRPHERDEGGDYAMAEKAEKRLTIDQGGYVGIGGQALTIHRITVHRSEMIDETGTGHALMPWGGDTDRIVGESTPSGRVFEAAPGVRAYMTGWGELAFQTGDKTLLAREMVRTDGRAEDADFGTTHAAGAERPLDADDLLDLLRGYWDE